MHKKDFSAWINLKEKLNNETLRPNIQTREVRWCSLGHNVGSEIDGKGDLFARPVIILKIISSNTCLVLPLTHSTRTGKFIYEFSFKEENIKARLDQIRIVDTKRIKSKIGQIPSHKFKEINDKAREFLF